VSGVRSRGRLVAAGALLIACVACGRAYDPSPDPSGVAGAADGGGADGAAEGSASSDAGLDGGSDDAAGSDLDSGADPADRARIFISSTSVGGNFGSINAGDAKCAALAAAQGLHGVYKAWLSDLVSDAVNRIEGNGPWYRIDGKSPIFGSKASLVLGPSLPILINEKGGLVSGAPVWTGTRQSGTGTNATCDGWTSAFSDGTIGESDKVGPSWTEAPSLTAPCTTQAHLICLRAD
jgi:hypothetical protein